MRFKVKRKSVCGSHKVQSRESLLPLKGNTGRLRQGRTLPSLGEDQKIIRREVTRIDADRT